jgi:hypothetical protein
MSSQFSTIIDTLNRGRLAAHIDEALMEIAQAVTETGGAGTLKLKLKITMSQHGEMVVGAEVDKTIPKAKVPPNIFFFDEDKQRFVRDDPKQATLDIDRGEESPNKKAA